MQVIFTAQTPVSINRFRGLLVMLPLTAITASAGHAQSAPEPISKPAQNASTPESATASQPTDTESTSDKPQKAKKRLFPPLGPDFEAVYLLDSKTRSRFGSTIYGIGPGIGSAVPPLKGKWGPNFSLLQASKKQNGEKNELFALSVGPEYKSVYIPRKFRDQMNGPGGPGGPNEGGGPNGPEGPGDDGGGPPPFLPYYGVGVNLTYAKVKVPGEGLNDSGIGVGGSLMVGLSFKERALIEARVRASTDVKGYGLSGVGLTFGLRF